MESLVTPAGFLEPLPRVLSLLAEVGGEKVKTANLSGILLEHVFHGEEVPRRFRHLLAAKIQEPVVKPEIDERTVRRRLRLGEFVFVVGKNEVLSSPVKIEGLSKVLHRHRRTLDMPPRTAPSQGLSQPGSFGFEAFHRAKSRGSSLFSPTAIRAPDIKSSIFLFDSLP